MQGPVVTVSSEGSGLPPRARRLAVLALSLGITSAVGSGSLTIVALPAIAQGLGIDAGQSVWVVNAYQLGTVITILAASALGEIWGYKRVYLAGLALLILSSFGAARSDTLLVLIAWRVVQGVGTAAMMAVNAALIRHVWPSRFVGRGISYNATVVAAATAASPIAAGLLVAMADWRLLFLIHVPLGLTALAMGAYVLPAPSPADRRFDAIAAALNAASFALLFFAVQGAITGQHVSVSIVQAVGASLAGGALVWRSRRQSAPLVPLDLFARPMLRASYAASLTTFVAQTIVLTSLPFALSHGLGLDQLDVGLAMTPWPLALMVGALISGRVIEARSPVVIGSIGLVLFATGIASLALSVEAGFAATCVSTALCGFGLGMFTTPNNRGMLMGAPVERSGAATGMIATVRLIGQTVGALLAAAHLKAEAGAGTAAFLAAAAIALLAAVLSVGRRRLKASC